MMGVRCKTLWLVAAATVLGCDSTGDDAEAMADGQLADATGQLSDMGTDAGATDAGLADTGATDTGATDTGVADMGAPSDLETAADWLTGDFSSRAQAMADRRYFDVHLYAIQIWPDRQDGVWMYVQQSRDDDDDGMYESPYRQRIYNVHADEGGQIVSSVYRIADEAAFVDPWVDPSVLDGLSSFSLQPAMGCDVMLRRVDDSYVGGTDGTHCRLSFGGYATSSVTLTEQKLLSLDLLYDEDGNIINGLNAASTPYTFEKHDNFPID